MSHPARGGQAPDQASSGRQTGAAVHTRTIIRKARKKAASPLKSHTRHEGTRLATAPDRPTQRILQPPEEVTLDAGRRPMSFRWPASLYRARIRKRQNVL